MSKIIQLTKGYETIVDDEDFEILSQWKWHSIINNQKKPTQHVYAQRSVKSNKERHNVKMHRQITGALSGQEVDHINGNTLDNRRCNLRIVTKAQNMQNAQKNKKVQVTKYPTSKYKGVTYSHSSGISTAGNQKIRKKRWHAHISLNGKVKSLGYHISEEDAARAYDHAALTYFKDFARLNFPEHQK